MVHTILNSVQYTVKHTGVQYNLNSVRCIEVLQEEYI